jgi:hypothetical protein
MAWVHSRQRELIMYICCRCTRYREVGVVRMSSGYIIIQVGGTYRTPAPTYVTIISLVYHESFSLHGRLIKCAILVFSRPFSLSTTTYEIRHVVLYCMHVWSLSCK